MCVCVRVCARVRVHVGGGGGGGGSSGVVLMGSVPLLPAHAHHAMGFRSGRAHPTQKHVCTWRRPSLIFLHIVLIRSRMRSSRCTLSVLRSTLGWLNDERVVVFARCSRSRCPPRRVASSGSGVPSSSFRSSASRNKSSTSSYSSESTASATPASVVSMMVRCSGWCSLALSCLRHRATSTSTVVTNESVTKTNKTARRYRLVNGHTQR